MASIFTYDPNPPRVSSPWATPGSLTPRFSGATSRPSHTQSHRMSSSPIYLNDSGLSHLEAEPQEGSTEYKLHLLLRPRRKFSFSSTGGQVSGSHHSKSFLAAPASITGTEGASIRPTFAPSSQTRQNRLQQLTTQLLWRLQQSSPFHSSSSSGLVLPVLPEATPRLNVPNKPAKLLPGIEESQGALYEIGVADDGTFIGLIEEELEESLTNLQAMAASLGCVVELLRKVIVGDCEWTEVSPGQEEPQSHSAKLWVAEALVRPDLETTAHLPRIVSTLFLDDGEAVKDSTHSVQIIHRKTLQLRVSLVGPSTSGKSSLLGTLSTSIFDNGRGRSRLSLLKHRHEIASGITSSVAQELIGYRHTSSNKLSTQKGSQTVVVNYASEHVSSWNDIHSFAESLVFLSDSPGLARYSKSCIRTLISWRPHWVIVCIAADGQDGSDGPESSALAHSELPPASSSNRHLELCLELGLPLVVAVTKFDLATKTELRRILTTILSTLKACGRKPVILSLPSAAPLDPSVEESPSALQYIGQEEEEEVGHLVKDFDREEPSSNVPIVLTSAVTGAGISRLHALLKFLPVGKDWQQLKNSFPNELPLEAPISLNIPRFHVDEVFAMPPSKVYSASSNDSSHLKQGIVLCGLVASGQISVGSTLMVGPFVYEVGENEATPVQQARSLTVSNVLADASTITRSVSPIERNATKLKFTFLPVRVVSIRNLRFPVQSLLFDQAGTVGIEPYTSTNPSCPMPEISLRRARKGMVLISPTSTPNPDLPAYRSFTVLFSSTAFASPSSPPLLLGGHAIAYLNSIRSAVKVIALTLADDDDESHSEAEPSDLFTFDADDDAEHLSTANPTDSIPRSFHSDRGKRGEVKITFRLSHTLEYFEAGDTAFVVPNTSVTGPVAGPVSGTTVAAGGLVGFVGRVVDCIE